MRERTYEQLCRDAHRTMQAIRDSEETPAECHFRVSPAEYVTLRNRPPFHLPELDSRRLKFYGMPIVVTPLRAQW